MEKKERDKKMKEIFNKVTAQKKLTEASRTAYYWIQAVQEDLSIKDDGTLEDLKEALEEVGEKVS